MFAAPRSSTNASNNRLETFNSPDNSFDIFTQRNSTDSHSIEIPQISLPKGGGALKGIDEQFNVNPSNGMATFSIPLPVSPGRNGLSPSLNLSYNSGAGNSPFGLGWSLTYPMISLRTDRRLPRYLLGSEEDTFTLGGEDLVPYLEENGKKWEVKERQEGETLIKQYRPRIEGSFARIERIVGSNGKPHWKVTERNNTTTFFGLDYNSRLVDPQNAEKIFAWLPTLRYDDKGNWIKYEYKFENLENVSKVLHEANRFSGLAPFTNLYLKRVKYGNRSAYYPDSAYFPIIPTGSSDYFFEMVLDYGEHTSDVPTPDEENPWDTRPDAYSRYRSGFEIRTYRRCNRILMFHHFQELGESPCLVRSLDLGYTASSINYSGQAEVSYLGEITQKGYIRREDGTYATKSLPPLSFSYQQLAWNTEIKPVEKEELRDAPVGLSNKYQWVDLYSEGISGILTEEAGSLYYKSNFANINADRTPKFSPAKQVAPIPSLKGLARGTLSIRDLEGNGQKQIVLNHPEFGGYYAIDDQGEFQSFQYLGSRVNTAHLNQQTRYIDLNGDGRADLVLTEENAFFWYASEGKKGFKSPEKILKPYDEEEGPSLLFTSKNPQELILLADMSGDGLKDILRIRNGKICYWPNKGYGKFGAKVSMSNAPKFDKPDCFHPQFIYLADISGTGATDIIYLSNQSLNAYLNLSGNSWSDVHEISPFLPIHSRSQVSFVDFLGTGSLCLVWSSDLPDDRETPMYYIDLMEGKKPHLMSRYANNMGKEVYFNYKSSTQFYLEDKLGGKPWITKLPFPVHLINRVEIEDHITQIRFSTEYRYHHGYFDYCEKEFRGFGMVEQLDTEHYTSWASANSHTQLDKSESLFQAPTLTKTWFHTGAFLDREHILTQYEKDYWFNLYIEAFPDLPLSLPESTLPDATLLPGKHIKDSTLIDHLSADEWREAFRACKGLMLRQEVFALDGEEEDPDSVVRQARPFSVQMNNCQIQLLQPRHTNPYGVFLVTQSESLNLSYEREVNDPRIAHTLNTQINDLGQILESASIVYPRKLIDPTLPKEVQAIQSQPLITYSQSQYTQDIIEDDCYRLRVNSQTYTFELTDIVPLQTLYQLSDFQNILDSGSTEIAYFEESSSGPQRRLIEALRTLFYDESLDSSLELGQMARHGISYESYQLVYTPELFDHIFGIHSPDFLSLMDEGKFRGIEGNWWVRSGSTQFKNEAESLIDVQTRFFTPLSYTDPYGAVTTVTYYKDHHLLIDSTTDAVDNTVHIEAFNFRTLSPTQIRDFNDNLTQVLLDELGIVKAMAIMGNGVEADNLNGLQEITDEEESDLIQSYFDSLITDQLHNTAGQLLKEATVRFVYNFERYQDSLQLRREQRADLLPCESITLLPTVIGKIAREEHAVVEPVSRLQVSFEYSDGMGNVALIKTQAEPGEALRLEIQSDCTYSVETIDTGTELRWLGNGRTILNNKGKPVKQYEPYFSDNPLYEDHKELVERGVTPLQFYDALGRGIKTELPDGTFSKVEFDSWKQASFDPNDTVIESKWYDDRIHRKIDPELRALGKDPLKEQAAAQKAGQHYGTPNVVHLDTLGRPVFLQEHNRIGSEDKLYESQVNLDIEGNVRSIIDARGNRVMQYRYDMLGNRIYQHGMDAGERWLLNNVVGNSMRTWDSRGYEISTRYDPIQRPVEVHLNPGDPVNERLIQKRIYGEEISNAKELNLKGQAYQSYDSSGRITHVRFDYKGNLLESHRQFAAAYDADLVDWSPESGTDILEEDLFTSLSTYDALNRIKRHFNWHRTTDRVCVYEPKYNERGLLSSEDHITAAQRTGTEHMGGRRVMAVSELSYNEKGQRLSLLHGNGTLTQYQYDPDTFRLLQLRTSLSSEAVSPPSVPPNLSDLNVLQNLSYTYDPIGNITEIEDDAYEPVFFSNQQIDPKSSYTYDALYRLIEATGRENMRFDDAPEAEELAPLSTHFPKSDQTLRNYTQTYSYDAVGNILEMRHRAGTGTQSERWTRHYEYALDSNRLLRTRKGSDLLNTINYSYDAHGNMRNYNRAPEEYLPRWDYRDMVYYLSLGGGGTAYYQYDDQRIRSRKRIERNGGQVEERLYLGGMELYKRYESGNLVEEIETHYLFVDNLRVLIVEEVLQTDNNSLEIGILDRYQYSNHLGSVSLELDGNASILSYEEYHPYGTVAYQMTNASVYSTTKRYRYTGMERDEESGLNYHAARYYMPWLGRWLKPDPSGVSDGINVFAYTRNNPVSHIDSNGRITQSFILWFLLSHDNAHAPTSPDYVPPPSTRNISDAMMIGPPLVILGAELGAMVVSGEIYTHIYWMYRGTISSYHSFNTTIISSGPIVSSTLQYSPEIGNVIYGIVTDDPTEPFPTRSPVSSDLGVGLRRSISMGAEAFDEIPTPLPDWVRRMTNDELRQLHDRAEELNTSSRYALAVLAYIDPNDSSQTIRYLVGETGSLDAGRKLRKGVRDLLGEGEEAVTVFGHPDVNLLEQAIGRGKVPLAVAVGGPYICNQCAGELGVLPFRVMGEATTLGAHNARVPLLSKTFAGHASELSIGQTRGFFVRQQLESLLSNFPEGPIPNPLDID
ncbi:MAG: SpvB/TcaC N-terminal domain-containing protein [Bacteroidota bacterium]